MKLKTFQRVTLVLIATLSLAATAMLSVSVLGGNTGPAEDDAPGKTALDLPLPQFTLTDSDGKAFSSQQLEGRLWVAAFVFTRCRLACPVMTARLEQLDAQLRERGLRDQVQFVLISVDPEHDTPAVLAEYAAAHDLNGERVTWLTGEKQPIWTLAREGFLLAVDDDPQNEAMPVAHSSRLVLVNARGDVHNYYESLDASDLPALIGDIERLAERQ